LSRALATARRLTSPDRTLRSGVAAGQDSRRGQEPSVPGGKDSAVDVGRADPVLSTRTESLAQLILAARAGLARAPGRRGGQSGPCRMGSDRPDGAIFTSPAKVGSGQRRPGTRRVGRLPPSLRRPGLRRGPRRGHPGHQESGHRAVYFRWPATSGSAPRSPPSPATAATPASGPRRSITPPAPPTKTTCAPSGSWPAPGSASSGLAGPTASPTTPPGTALAEQSAKANCGLRLA
jgi:hypothetical protein